MEQDHVVKLIRDDLLALGVDVDSEIIERMQKLGLNSSWSTASRAATSLRKRNPHGVPSSVAYQNIHSKNVTRSEHRDLDQEWDSVNTHRIHRIIHSLYDQPSVHFQILKMFKVLRMQYLRSPGMLY